MLEFMGASGKSGSGRYSVINGLANVSVLLMISVDGWGAARWGRGGYPLSSASPLWQPVFRC
jgi:hypothetical protein